MNKDLFVLPEKPSNEYIFHDYYCGEFSRWYEGEGLPEEIRARLSRVVADWPFQLAQSLIVDVAYSVWSANVQDAVDDVIAPDRDMGDYWRGYREAVESVLEYLAPAMENGSPALGKALNNLEISGHRFIEKRGINYSIFTGPAFFVNVLDQLWRYAKDGEEQNAKVNFKRKPFGCVEFVSGGNTALPPSVETLLAYDLELRFRVYSSIADNPAISHEDPVGTVVTYGMTMPKSGRPYRELVSLIVNDCLSTDGGWNADRVRDRLRDFVDRVAWFPWPTMLRPLGMLGRKANWLYQPTRSWEGITQGEAGGVSAEKSKITPPRSQ